MVPLVLSLWYVGHFLANPEHCCASCFLLQHPQALVLQAQPHCHAFMWPGITIVPASSTFSLPLNEPGGFIANEEKGGCQKPQRPQLGSLSAC